MYRNYQLHSYVIGIKSSTSYNPIIENLQTIIKIFYYSATAMYVQQIYNLKTMQKVCVYKTNVSRFKQSGNTSQLDLAQ